MNINKKIVLIALISGLTLSSYNNNSIFASASGGLFGTPDPKEIKYPAGIAPSEAEINLGKTLFFDNRLSGSKAISCASCHNPELGLSDGQALSVNANGDKTKRNSPHLNNLAWSASVRWDGSMSSIEQVTDNLISSGASPLFIKADVLVNRLNQVPYYKDSFAGIYPEKGISQENIVKALGAFQRTLISNNSPFDQYLKGKKTALGDEAVRGLKLFKGKASCIVCHAGANLSDNNFHNIGIGGDDAGRFEYLKLNEPKMAESFKGAFKTPGLRNVFLTSPYMHDGSLKSLEDVVRFYNKGGNQVNGKSKLIRPLELSDREIFDLVAFLSSLTDPVKVVRPEVPPVSASEK